MKRLIGLGACVCFLISPPVLAKTRTDALLLQVNNRTVETVRPLLRNGTRYFSQSTLEHLAHLLKFQKPLRKRLQKAILTVPSLHTHHTRFFSMPVCTGLFHRFHVDVFWNGHVLNVVSQKFEQEIATFATHFLGTRYDYGGTTPHGFDCSGFTKFVYAHFGISLPRTAAQMAACSYELPKKNLLPGSLVFFNTTGSPFSHVGIYLGHDRFISATSSRGVQITSLLNAYYWKPRFTAARFV